MAGLTFSPITGKIQGNSSVVTAVAKLGGESAFTFRVTGGAMGCSLRMPKVDANTENVSVTISDLSGRKVWSLSVDPRLSMRELAWDGRDLNGHLVAGGMYTVRISATSGGKTSTVTNKAVSLDQ